LRASDDVGVIPALPDDDKEDRTHHDMLELQEASGSARSNAAQFSGDNARVRQRLSQAMPSLSASRVPL
jgi:hypothetical protein